MLAIVSDLHLQHVAHDGLRWRVAAQTIEAGVRRNVSPRALQRFLWMTLVAARRRHARTIHLVLAGDIFEIHRTPLWLEAGRTERPYASGPDPGATSDDSAPLRARVIEILEAIEHDNREFFAVLRRFASAGRVRYDGRSWTLDWSGAPRLRVHYLPGNHDRLLAAWPATRRRARELLGMPSGEAPFPHRLDDASFDEPYGVRIRHGHEYDPTNFSIADPRAALDASESDYGAPVLGDFVTIDFATRLATAMRALYARELRQAGADGDRYRRLYLALTEFDDVRPPSLVVDYLMHVFGGTAGETFEVLRPLLRDVIDEALTSPFFRRQAERLGYWNPALATALGEGIKHLGADQLASLARRVLGRARQRGTPPARRALEEPDLGDSVQILVAGHTHRPDQVPLPGGGELFYVDSGTWRTTLPFGEAAFGRLRAYTAVYCMSEAERQHGDGRRLETWTGKLIQQRYGPFETPVARSTRSAARVEPVTQQLRPVRLHAQALDERRAELRLRFGVDGAGRELSRDGVRSGQMIDLSMLDPIPLDQDLDGELWLAGLEADTPALLDLDDPLPWGLMRLPRRRGLPRTPFLQRPGSLTVAGRGPFRLRLDWRIERRRA